MEENWIQIQQTLHELMDYKEDRGRWSRTSRWQTFSYQPANTWGCSGGGSSSFSTFSESMADDAMDAVPLPAPAAVSCVSRGKLSSALCTFCSTSSVQSIRSLSSCRAPSMTRSCLSPSPVSSSRLLWTWVRAALPEDEEAAVGGGQFGDVWPDM